MLISNVLYEAWVNFTALWSHKLISLSRYRFHENSNSPMLIARLLRFLSHVLFVCLLLCIQTQKDFSFENEHRDFGKLFISIGYAMKKRVMYD